MVSLQSLKLVAMQLFSKLHMTCFISVVFCFCFFFFKYCKCCGPVAMFMEIEKESLKTVKTLFQLGKAKPQLLN